MKTKMKKLLLTILLITVVFSLFNFNYKVEASTNGMTQDDAINWVKSKIDKVIGSGQCVALISEYYMALGQTTPHYEYAYQLKDQADYQPSGWQTLQGVQPQKGDILIYLPSAGNGAGHVAIYESDNVTYHQNYGGQYVRQVTNRYDQMYDIYGNIMQYWGVVRPDFAPADTKAPEVGNVTVSEKNKEGFTITADVSDDVGVTKVSFYVTVNGKEITFNAPSISDGKASVRINYADYDLTEGTSTATANIWAYDAAGKTSNTGNIGTVNIDLNDPVISNVEVSDVTGTGYVLTFKVSDNVGVTKVQCPTWNESNDRDEMEGSNWETNPEYTAIEKAGVYTYHVNIDNDTFQNEGGTYKTQITAFDEYGNTVQENVEVEVYPITDVTLNESEATIYKGQELVLEATYEPENTTGDTEVTWTSSDEEVATVKDGVVTALKEGTTTITATIDGVEATCELTVKEIPLGSIEIEEQNVSLNVGEEKDLHVLYNPEDTTDDKTVVWTSSDESVITVSEDGKVKALKAGKATITATVGDKTATTEIVVNEEQGTGTSVLPKTGDMQVVLLALGMVISAAGIIFMGNKPRIYSNRKSRSIYISCKYR